MRPACLLLFLVACGGETTVRPREEVLMKPPEPPPSADLWGSAPAALATTAPEGETFRTSVHRVVSEHRAQVKLCYEKGLAKDKGLTGRVSVRFLVDASGQVASAEAVPPTSMPDAGVVTCILQQFHAMQFPPHDGAPIAVVYPFVFTAADP